MGCQLKKQNNNQGGAHLTERTCSPYNPIIKLIVDDCLGLPVYPVTSVDAVIDENGDTLRKLLLDLLDKIKEGSFNVQQLLLMIEEALSRLSDIYASKEALDNIKALLWAISSIMSKSDNPTENDLYVAGTYTPKIVDAVLRLQDIVCALTGTCEGLSEEDIPSIIDLKELLDILQDVLVAIANFDTNYTVVDEDELGLETKDNNARIKIIQEILDIKSLIGDGTEEGTPPDGGTLVQKIQWLIDNVKQLLTESKTHAHLDLSVLDLMPKSVRTGNSESKKDLFKVLKASELPPTAIVIATSGSHINKQYGYPIYVGNLKKADAGNLLDFYPFGHTGNAGYPIKYVRRDPLTNVVVDLFLVVDENNLILRAGNGQFDMDDIVQSLQIISGNDVEFLETVKSSQLATFLNNNATYANFVVDVSGTELAIGNITEFSVGDVTRDGEVSVNDINAIITAITTANSLLSNNLLSNMNNTQLFVFETSNNVDTVAMYPCIKGKTYVDVLTGNMYVYEGGRMNRVVNNKFVGTNGIEVNEVKDYEDEDATVLTKKEPYTKYIIGLDRDNLLIESEDEFTLFELSNPDDFKFTLLKYNVKCDLEYDEDRTSGALYYLDSYVFKTIPKATYLNAETNPYTPNPTYTLDDYSQAPEFFAELGNAFRSIILESLIASKQQAEAEGNTAEVAILEQQIALTRSRFNATPPSSSNRPLQVWPNSPGPDVLPIVITGPYTKASVINQILDFDGDNYFTPNDVNEIGLSLLGTEATEKTVNTGIMLKRYADNSQVTIESSPEVVGRIFEVVGENEYKTLYYFNKYGEFRPLLPDYSISFSNSVGELQLRRDGKVMSSLDIMEPIMLNVSSIVIANQQENLSNVRTKLLAVRNESQEINLGNDADPFFLGSPTYFDIDEINPDILNLFDNKLNLTVGSSFVHNQFDEEESLINLENIPVPLSLSFLDDTDLEINKIIEDLFTPIYDAIELGDITDEEVELMLAEAIANPIEYVQLKLHSNYINLEGNAAITNCWIYTIKKTITLHIDMDDIDHQSDYSALVFRNIRVDIIDKVPVTVNTIYYFPKYDLRLKFDLATLNGQTYYEPVILSIGSRFDITKKNSNSDFTVIVPNYTEYINIPDNYVSLDLVKLVNIPGYKQIKVQGILNFESTDDYYINFLNNSLNYPMSLQGNSSDSTPNLNPSIPPRTVNDQNTLNNVYPVNIAVEQILPDHGTKALLQGNDPAEFQYTIFNGYFNLVPL